MSKITKTVHSIASLQLIQSQHEPSEPTSNLALPLSAPIVIESKVNETALLNDLLEQMLLMSSAKGMPSAENSSIENAVKQDDIILTVGVDEVGRGPLYGSMVIAAVVLPQAYSGSIEKQVLKQDVFALLTDSKKISEAKREQLFPLIKQEALAHITVDVPASVIDEMNILQATLTGMRLASEHLMIHIVDTLAKKSSKSKGSKLAAKVEDSGEQDGFSSQWEWINSLQFQLLIDGNKVPKFDWQMLATHGLGERFGERIHAEAWVKGDARHTAIAAASVLAKVTRDTQLKQEGLVHTGYGLETHKGYPTEAHIAAIQKLGVLPQHRKSFKPVQQALQEQTLKK